MFRKVIIAGATVAAFAVPTVAQAEWNIVLLMADARIQMDQSSSLCQVVERSAEPGEMKIAGPFESQEAAEESLPDHADCKPRDPT